MESFIDHDLPRLAPDVREDYEEAGLWGEETFVDKFEEAIAANPDAAIVGPNRQSSHGDVLAEALEIALGLEAHGISSGAVVSYQLPNWTDTVAIHLGISLLGAIPNPIVPIYRQSEVQYILGDAESEYLFIPDTYRNFNYVDMVADVAPELESLQQVFVLGDTDSRTEAINGAQFSTLNELKAAGSGSFTEPALSANDIHVLVYTSGTTGNPKGVIHTHNTLMYAANSAIDHCGLTRETTVFLPSPVTHVSGLLFALELPFIAGMDLVLMDQWDPAEAVDLIDEHDCNLGVGATPFLQGINEEWSANTDCPLRVFICGGADIPPELIRRSIHHLDCTIMRMYGSTESPNSTWQPLDAPLEKLVHTDGPASPAVEFKIVDVETGKEVEPNEAGEIQTRGPQLMVGYLGEELNEEAFEGSWFKTGDIGKIDEDGYLTCTGRVKDIIIRGGENIPVKPVEDLIYEHHAVKEIAIVAMPDEELQEKGCAYVVLEQGASFSFDEMVSYLDEQGIAQQKYPERLEVVEELPTTASGKIRKNELRQDVADKLGLEPVTRK